MKIQLRKRMAVLMSVLFAAVVIGVPVTGCGTKERADLTYPNKSYSYEEEKAGPVDSWCPYEEEYLQKLKEEYDLDALVADCETEFEKVQAVTEWVSNLWSHNGENIPEQSDPLFILKSVTEDGEQYRCVEYAVVIAGCLNSLGIPARSIGLKTKDVETRDYAAGHVATEAYLKDYRKWVFIDGQWGLIPLMGDMPLNAVQFSEVIQHPEDYEEALQFLSFLGENGAQKEYCDWINEYLYYFDVIGYIENTEGRKAVSLMLLPQEAEPPAVFQIHYPLEIDIYTNSVPRFYPKAL